MSRDDKILDLINEIIQKLTGQIDLEKIVLFGSQVTGKIDEYSDLDILINAAPGALALWGQWDEPKPAGIFALCPGKGRYRLKSGNIGPSVGPPLNF